MQIVSRQPRAWSAVVLLFVWDLAVADFSIDPQSNFNGPTHARVKEILTPVETLLTQVFARTPERLIEVYVRPEGPKVDLVYNVQRIGLSAQEHFYMQYVYQFAHEMGHVLTNWQDSDTRQFKWFEETICELASVYVIRIFAETRPYGVFTKEQWLAYVETVRKNHADQRFDRFGIGPTTPSRYWFPKVSRQLSYDSLIRELNGGIAFDILPHVLEHPHLWQAFAYLNQWDTSRDKDFRAYLNSWGRTLARNGQSLEMMRIVHRIIYG